MVQKLDQMLFIWLQIAKSGSTNQFIFFLQGYGEVNLPRCCRSSCLPIPSAQTKRSDPSFGTRDQRRTFTGTTQNARPF